MQPKRFQEVGRNMTDQTGRGMLFRWLGWFAAANVIVLAIASLRYLVAGVEVPLTLLSTVYLATSYLGHLGLLTSIPLILVVTPVILFIPRRNMVMAAAIILMALAVAFLTLDSLLWTQSRFHMNLFTLRILGTSSWIFGGVMMLIALLFESILANGLWQWLQQRNQRKGWIIGTALGLSLLVSQAIHAWADASFHMPVTAISVNLPGYRGITAKSLLQKTGLVDVQHSRERNLARRMSGQIAQQQFSSLKYPLTPLRCTGETTNNLLLLVIDSMRSDTVSRRVTPHIDRLARRSGIRFNQHYSGGNSSMIGLFSIFYGLPPGYFETIKSMQQPPVLISELQKRRYQFGIHSSSSLTRPSALDSTAFATVANLADAVPSEDLHHTERVEVTNRQWHEWIGQLDPDKPFFSFVYFDSSRKPLPDGSEPVNSSASHRDFLEYEEAMRANDALVGTILDALRQRKLLESTVLVITSDHGEQFGEFDPRVIGHGSGYSREQMQVPLVLHWPGEEAREIDTRTSHYDMVPTLMKRLLNCQNLSSDFSSGSDLLTRDDWQWLLAGSYYNYAVLEPDQVTITYPNGRFEVRDWDYVIREEPIFRAAVLQEVIRENSRFHP